MKIKVYIVTYKRPEVLNANLKSFWQNTKNPQNIEVTILSNYPECIINEENKRPNLRVVYNTTRMPHAWGYLSRDWNYCILDCFKTSDNPDNVDWLVLAQNDVTWVEGWDEYVRNNKKYDLISQPKGDQAILMNIEAVKKIGFFDERFTTLHWHEQDYFLRSVLLNKDRVSINDEHKRPRLSINTVGNVITNLAVTGVMEDETLHNKKNLEESTYKLLSKGGVDMCKVTPEYLELHREDFLKCSLNEINWYPFFWKGNDKIVDKYKQNLKLEFEKKDKTRLPKSVTDYKKYSEKLKKHTEYFICFKKPFHKWIFEPFAIVFYFIRLLLNSYFYRRLISGFIFNKQKRRKFRQYYEY